jgi:Flp pilus assembly protein TadD
VTDFSLFGDEGLKNDCITTQIESMEQRLSSGQNTASLHLHLGALYGELGLPGDAFRHFTEAAKEEPQNAHVHHNQAIFFSKQGRTKEAIQQYLETLRLDPYYLDASNNLAWVFATHENPMFRNGDKAVQLSEQACQLDGRRDPFLLDTLAAAYAEVGRFEEARLTALEAIDRAKLTGFDHLVGDIERRLRLYQSGQPYRKEAG